MKFLPFFELRIRHPFYTDERCADFVIEPTPESAALLHKRRSSLKLLPNGLRVVTHVTDDDKPFIPFSEGEMFSFRLRLENADFPLFTDLTDREQLAAPLYTNVGLGASDQPELKLGSRQASFSEELTVSAPAIEERFVLSGMPLPGLTASEFQVASSASVGGISQYMEADKLITVDSRAAKQGQTFTVQYPVRPERARGVFADVNIYVNGTLPHSQLSKNPRVFRITFGSKLAKWAYYCVTNVNGALGSLTIVDAMAETERPRLVFGAQNRTDLAEQPDLADGLARELAERYPDLRRVRFISNERVASQQAPIRNLELRMDGDKLSSSLPNPSFRNYATVQGQDVLFQVVKVLAKSGV